MQTVTITARTGKGEDVKEFSGEFQKPDSLAEATELEGSEDRVLELYWQIKKISHQSSLRNPGSGESRKGKGKAAKNVYDKCISAGLEDAQAREISGYTGSDE